MADWQWTIIREHPADFLRGLFHSDGCRASNWKTISVSTRAGVARLDELIGLKG